VDGRSGEGARFGCRSLGSGCKGDAAAVRTAKQMDRGCGSYRGGSGSGTARQRGGLTGDGMAARQVKLTLHCRRRRASGREADGVAEDARSGRGGGGGDGEAAGWWGMTFQRLLLGRSPAGKRMRMPSTIRRSDGGRMSSTFLGGGGRRRTSRLAGGGDDPAAAVAHDAASGGEDVAGHIHTILIL